MARLAAKSREYFCETKQELAQKLTAYKPKNILDIFLNLTKIKNQDFTEDLPTVLSTVFSTVLSTVLSAALL